MRQFAATIALALLAAACGDSAAVTTAGPVPTTTTMPVTPTTPPTTATTVAAPATTLATDPLTRRDFDDEELVLMTMKPRNLPVAGFSLETQKAVPNTEAIREALLDPIDEAEDVERFGRLSGARAAFRSSRLRVDTRGVLEIHTAVNLFETESGASGYLVDFLQDAAKGVGAPRPTDLEISDVLPFVVEDLGAEAVGLTVAESAFGEDEAIQFETWVGFRIGSLLAFTSLVHAEEGDFRIRALEMAAALEEHVIGVLRGSIRTAPPEPEPELLEAFAFRYEQVVDRRTVLAEIVAEGVVVLPDAVYCDFTLRVDGRPDSTTYILVGDDAWSDAGGGFIAANPDSHFLAADTLYCPGWAVPLSDSGLDLALQRSAPLQIELEDGSPALAYSMGLRELEEMGFVPEDSGLTVERFDVVTPVLEEWVLQLDLELSGRAPQFVTAFGKEFEGPSNERVRLRFHFEIDRINDSSLSVTPPG